ncbi:hypothetical protein TELCIR_08152 [Teladorsagia circumcincta]|uniref:Peptidase M12A domain-containing protein n=1 Tax=Teladorsagia circumcincta TaxID=45464 RepID=A0A2G9UKI7_TELCI|nr:hypothetical protein TELCIR_08152 [Teladorsagia circumcincta]
MKIILLTLLLTVAVNGGFLDDLRSKVKNLFRGELFSRTVLNIHDKFIHMQDKVLKSLKLSPEMVKSLRERLEKLPKFPHDHINKKGDSITEINEKSKVGEELFQSDIILTGAQAEDIVEDIEEEIGGTNRTKRQAVTYRPDVKLWNGGVNYYFNSTVGHVARSVFKKAADVWQRDTCIDFRYDPYGKCQQAESNFTFMELKWRETHALLTTAFLAMKCTIIYLPTKQFK